MDRENRKETKYRSSEAMRDIKRELKRLTTVRGSVRTRGCLGKAGVISPSTFLLQKQH